MKKEIKRISHEIKIRLLTVAKIEDVTPYMRRITFTGNELAGFVSSSPEDHVKVFFPEEGSETPLLPTMTENGPVFGEGLIMRDYTPKNYRTEANELDLEFVLHKKGPASRWAAQAKVGQTLGIAGPRGSAVYPEFKNYLLIGDDSAIPSIARRLEELPSSANVIAIIETENENSEQELASKAETEILWLHREGKSSGTPELFLKALRSVSPEYDDTLAIVSCEINSAKEIKRVLLEDYAFPEEWIKSTGYWK